MNSVLVMASYLTTMLGMIGTLWFSNRQLWCKAEKKKFYTTWLRISCVIFIIGLISMLTMFGFIINR